MTGAKLKKISVIERNLLRVKKFKSMWSWQIPYLLKSSVCYT